MKIYEQLIFEIRLFEDEDIGCDIVNASNPNDNDFEDIEDWGF